MLDEKIRKKYTNPEFLFITVKLTDIIAVTSVVEEFSDIVIDGDDWG